METETTEEDFEVKDSPIADAGKGVFTKITVPQGAYLHLKARGVTVGVERRFHEIPSEFIGYCIARGNDLYHCPVDFSNMEPVWYLNHSNSPNAEQRDDGYYSLKALEAGEEILIDYNTLNEPEDMKEDFYKL